MFQPIEDMFPEWADARNTVSSFIPDRVQFSIREDRFTLDHSWFGYLAKASPLTAVELLQSRMEYVFALLRNYVEVNNYNLNLKDKLDYSIRNQVTLNSLNDSLQSEENLRAVQGKETILDLYRHAFGIKECDVSNY